MMRKFLVLTSILLISSTFSLQFVNAKSESIAKDKMGTKQTTRSAKSDSLVAIPMGDPGKNRDEEMRQFKHSALTSTGIFLPKGEQVVIHLDEKPESVQVKIGQFGTYDDTVPGIEPSADMVSYPLVKGDNEISRDDSGGMVYIENTSDTQMIHFTISGGKKVPVFHLGTTSGETFAKEIKEADSSIPFVEMDSPHILATIQLARVKDIYQSNVNAAKKAMENFEKVYSDEVEAHGLREDVEGVAKKHPDRIHIANPVSGAGYLYAANNYLGIKSDNDGDTSIWQSVIGKTEWGLYHEAGHTFQNLGYVWSPEQLTEVTVNIYSNYVNKKMGNGDLFDANYTGSHEGLRPLIKKYLEQPKKNFDTIEENTDGEDPFWIRLGLFINLSRAFGDDFYPALNQAYRMLPAHDIPTSEEGKKQFFIQMTSKLVNRNLTPFFEMWGISVAPDTKNKIKGYPKLEKEIWKDMFATEAEEKNSTYRLHNLINSYTIPTVKNLSTNFGNMPIEKLSSINVIDKLTLLSKPISSKTEAEKITTVANGPDYSDIKSNVVLKNDSGYQNKVPLNYTTTPGNSIVIKGINDDNKLLLWMDKASKKLMASGAETSFHYNEAKKYIAISVYRDGKEIKEVTGNRQDIPLDIAKELSNFPLKNDDIIKIYHSEAENRLLLYKSDELIPHNDASKETFYYEVKGDSWGLLTEVSPKVKVQYQDSTRKDVISPSKLTGKLGESYTTAPKPVAGYWVQGYPSEQSGYFGAHEKVLTYGYKTSEVAKQVKHIKFDAKVVKDSEPIWSNIPRADKAIRIANNSKAYIGKKVSITEKATTGGKYTYYKFAVNGKTIGWTDRHTFDVQPVTIKYVDSKGKELAQSEATEGNLKKAYDVKPKAIAGYWNQIAPSNRKGKFDTKAHTVTFKYAKSETAKNVKKLNKSIKISKTSEAIWSNVPRAEKAIRIADSATNYKGKTVKVIKQATTGGKYTYYQFRYKGKTIGWMDKRVFK